MHEKKLKGDIGVAHAIAELTEQQWNVCLPLTEHASYDLIAEKKGACRRIQVRYTTPSNGCMSVRLRSIWADKKGIHVKNRSVEDYDVLAVYCPSNKHVYFVPSGQFENEVGLTLRLEKAKNNQAEGVRMAASYLEMK
jgi:hypothetical protein